MTHLTITIIFAVLLFPAIFLTLIPMLPVLPYMFVMSLLYGIIDHFEYLSWWRLGILFGIFCLSVIVDYSAGILGAKYAGASKQSLLYGMIGLIAGSILFPPFGGLPGLFLTVFVSELFLDKERVAAFRVATGSLIGTAVGITINFALAILFFGLFFYFSIF